MKRLTKLTDEHRALFPKIAKKWIKIGTKTDEADWEKFEGAARRCYGFADLKPPKAFVRVSSPLVLSFAAPAAAWFLAVEKTEHGMFAPKDRKEILEKILDSAFREEENVVAPEVFRAVEETLGAVARNAAGRNAGETLSDDAYRSLCSTISSFWSRYLGGQFWVFWQAYCDFFRTVGLELDGDIWDREAAYRDAQSSACWWWPHREFCMVCNRPKEIHLANNRLHREGGPALAWRDGWKTWFLRGARVSRTQAETPPEEMTREWLEKHYLDEPNAQVRAEVAFRMGKGLLVSRLGMKTLKREGDMYELVEFETRGKKRRALKMKNPSVPGLVHIEEVPPDCATVEAAIHARKPAALRALPIDDEAGADWTQQGDVCIWPQNAKSVKSRPSELT